ncbi:hypothetical protein EC973_002103 [Apophysomyces ossiformis]|uniref:Heme haloperoxidase family profile domain-containing protein n=1 Tax=Apophysomyces ossiformis TaxID=679940 RepID=A0A8H7EN38_9FUNG|nr:hypothetical protein EC973_002103 [Apophysomyces ossiformis]
MNKEENNSTSPRAPFWKTFSISVIASAFIGLFLLQMIRVEIHANLSRLDQDEWKEFMKTHPYERRFNGDDASRSPCPALNTLANHGLISRNGRNVTFDELYTAVKLVGLGPVSSYMTLAYVYYTFHKNRPSDSVMYSLFKIADTINLDELANHNVLEHDVSLSRNDLYVEPHNVINPVPARVALMTQFATNGTFTAQNQYDYRKFRWLESLRDNPQLYYSTFLQLIAGTECVVLQEVLGRGKGMPVDHLQAFFLEERFPDDWYPPTRPLSGFDLAWKTLQCVLSVRSSSATLENTPQMALVKEKQ